MIATPKSVIMAVVIFLGLIVLGVIAGSVVLQLTGNGAMPGDIQNLGLVALGALAGVLATTRTTPELPPGAVLTQGQTTITTPTVAENAGETPSGLVIGPPRVRVSSSPLSSLADQGIDPANGVSSDYPRNANADPA